MKYMVAGILKEGTQAELGRYSTEFSEHLAQPFRQICFAAALRKDDGKPLGYTIVIEASSIKDAHNYLEQSPFFQAGLYERVQVAEFDVLLGAVG